MGGRGTQDLNVIGLRGRLLTHDRRRSCLADAIRRWSSDGLLARIGKALGHLRARGKLRGRGAEPILTRHLGIGEIKESGAAGDVRDVRTTRGLIGALAPVGVGNGIGTWALRTAGSHHVGGVLIGHRVQAGVIRLDQRTLVGVLTILKLGEVDAAHGKGSVRSGLVRSVDASLINHGHGSRVIRGIVRRGGVKGEFRSHTRIVSMGRARLISDRLGGRLNLGVCGGRIRDGRGLVVASGVLARRINLVERLGNLGLINRGGHGNHADLGLDVGDGALGRKDSKLTDDLLAMARSDYLLDLATHLRLTLLGLRNALGHGLCGISLGPLDLDPLGHTVHHAKHGGNGGLVVNGAGGIGHELARDKRDAPDEKWEAGNKTNDPKRPAGGLGNEAKKLNQSTDGNGGGKVDRIGGQILLSHRKLRTREEVKAAGVVVRNDDDRTLALRGVHLGLSNGNDVLAVSGGAKLSNDIAAGIDHPEQREHRGNKNEANDRRRHVAHAHQEKANEQQDERHAIGHIPKRGSREILKLGLEPMCRELLGKVMGAVKLLLAASRRYANLGVEALEVILSDAHPFTFRIATESLLAVVLESIRLPSKIAN